MSLDPGVVGAECDVQCLRYDWKTLALYALGIGAKRDELDYLYEGRGPKAYPTFGVVPAYPVLSDLLARCKGPLDRLVHGAQSVRVHAALPARGEIQTTGVITGVHDLKRMAQMVFTTRSTVEGVLVYETEWRMLFLGEGGFGGARPPKTDAIGRVSKESTPVFSVTEEIAAEQALLYRLSGDPNPLHVDPEFAKRVGFEQGPILHGLATYGFCARALIKGALGGDASRLRAFHAQFRKPVWPGEALNTIGFEVDDGYSLKAYAGGREDVVALCSAEVSPVSAGSV
jgi:acyl dehydratase